MPLRLTQIDTNLLVALDVLLAERHVTRAARRLGVTQSAMSQTLRRLRHTFDDPLLVRTGSRMVPTPRAEALVEPLRSALLALEHALGGGAAFDPAASTRVFRIAMLDSYAGSLLPRLTERVAACGRGLGLDVLPLDRRSIWEQLRGGDVELAVLGPWEIPADIVAEPLLTERLVGMVRRGHPLLDGSPITPERFVAHPHAVFRITGRGEHPIDERLAAIGLTRRIVCRLPYFQAAPALSIDSDVVVSVPVSAARAFRRSWAVELFELPLPPPAYVISVGWPRFLDADPGSRWLRRRVKALGAALGEV